MESMTNMHSNCPLCGGVKLKILYGLNYPVIHCANCTLIFVGKEINLDENDFYNESYYRGMSSQKENLGNENVLDEGRIKTRLDNCSGIVESISGYVKKVGKWLDIGCGPGFLLSEAMKKGWAVTGVEASSFSATYARANFQIENIVEGTADKVDFQDSSFDVISMQHVIEHFQNPIKTMEKIARWLKKDGIIYIETPDIDSHKARKEGAKWEHIKLPEHLFYFSPKTLNCLLKQNGFKSIAIKHQVSSTGLLNTVCGGKRQSRLFYEKFKQYRTFSGAVGIIRYINAMYRHGLKGEGDIMQVIAVKK